MLKMPLQEEIKINRKDDCKMNSTYFPIAIACALIGWAIGNHKGRIAMGIICGFMLGPIGVIVIACMPSALGEKCPFCGGRMNKGASACCHCGRQVHGTIKVAKVVCPMCGKAIARSQLRQSNNICPYCGETVD